jgi:hypothetical protein
MGTGWVRADFLTAIRNEPLEHMPLIDVPNTSIKDEINDLTLKIKEVVDELSSMVDKSTVAS